MHLTLPFILKPLIRTVSMMFLRFVFLLYMFFYSLFALAAEPGFVVYFSQDTLYDRSNGKEQRNDSELLAWLIDHAAGRVIKLQNRVYTLNTLHIRANTTIVGSVSTMLRPADNVDRLNSLINVYGVLQMSHIQIDGMEKVAWGIMAKNSLILRDVVIRNLRGTSTRPASAVRHDSGEIDSYLELYNCEIRNIKGYEDGIIGNYIGAHRGVSTTGGRIKITNSNFVDIHGSEDGDGIHVITGVDKNGNWLDKGSISIRDCKFVNFGKRGIKIQGSNARIENCSFIKDTSQGIEGYAAISIYGDNCIIENNTISVANCTAGITITSGNHNRIVNNQFEIDKFLPEGQTWPVVVNTKGRDIFLEQNRFSIYNRRDFLYSTSISKNNISKMRKANSIQRFKR